jgi:phosphatidylglycerophosphate synthase
MIYSFKRDFKKGLLPNSITTAGLLTIPFIIVSANRQWWLLTLTLFTLAWLSDFFDGWLARRLKLNTQIGAFYDPLADKIFTFSFLFFFWSQVHIALIVTIIAIGVGLTSLRVYKWYYGATKRVDYSIAASISGKAKTNLEKSAFAIIFLGQTLFFSNIISPQILWSMEIFANCVLLTSIFFATFSLIHQIKNI